ncbi:MAG: NAD-dependent epimerase/dehydratase family protein [Pyrinomonadaceae bacterium]
MKRILITGGAGYIGSVLTSKLLTLGFELVVLDAFFYTNVGISALLHHPLLRIVKGDIRDLAALKTSLTGVDCVIHLAALANDPSAELDLKLTRQINLDSYLPLLETAVSAGVQRFINLSSIGVYGINYSNGVTEDDPVNPLTEYARCKAMSEALVKQSNTREFTTVSLRCGTVCGWSPRMRLDLSTNTLAAYAICNKKLTVWGGDQQRPQIHLEDVTDFIIKLISVPAEKIGGRVFNAAGYNTTVRNIAETIKAVMNGELELISGPARSDERSYRVNSDRIANELGFKMTRTIKDAVVDIVRAHENGLWSDPDDALYHNIKRMRSMKVAAAI